MAHIALKALEHYRHKLCSGILAKRQRILRKVEPYINPFVPNGQLISF